MLTIIDAAIPAGYSRWDHLITGREGEAAIGRTARTVAEARKIAAAAIRAEADHRLWPEVWVAVRFADGHTCGYGPQGPTGPHGLRRSEGEA